MKIITISLASLVGIVFLVYVVRALLIVTGYETVKGKPPKD